MAAPEPAGWYPDPDSNGGVRYFDGENWTTARAPREPSQPVGSQVNAAPFYLPNLIAAMIASVSLVIGSIGPWITFFALSRGNVDGDGMVTLILGIVAGVSLFVLLNLGRGRVTAGWMIALAWTGFVAGMISFAIAVYAVVQVSSRKTELFGQTIGAQVGWGLWLVLIASLVLAATSVVVASQIPKLRRA